MPEWWHILIALIVLAHLAGLLFSVDAIMYGRTPQGTIGWSVALMILPYATVPLYLMFGARRFEGYVRARRRRRGAIAEFAVRLERTLAPHTTTLRDTNHGDTAVSKMLATPVTRDNAVRLLIDGDEFFPAVWELIDTAKAHLVVQFYIIRGDETGLMLKARLLAAVRRGVKVWLLYDAIGSSALSNDYLNELQASGVEVAGFKALRGPRMRLQINFRNHRKMVVADGHTSIIGGMNVGDEYRSLQPECAPWRDTGLMVSGPASLEGQLAFAEDWYCSTGKLPDLNWEARSAEEVTPGAGKPNARVVIAPTGPADELPTGALMVLHLISSAKSRLWIATPYFVPDLTVVEALQLASLRGVDVRIITPVTSDSFLVRMAMLSYEPEIIPSGARMYAHQPGFMHQKVVLSDDVAAVGSLNLDNRSMRINFELMGLVADKAFVAAVEAMLLKDLKDCLEITQGSLRKQHWGVRVGARLARLVSPIL